MVFGTFTVMGTSALGVVRPVVSRAFAVIVWVP